MNELQFYDKIKNWDFSMINHTNENLTKWDLLALLMKTPILVDFFEEGNNDIDANIIIDNEKINKYIMENTTDKGILLIRRYYGITGVK